MIVALDYETTGLNYWESDFRILSAAFVHTCGNKIFIEGEDAVKDELTACIEKGYTFVVQNASFEWGCTFFRYGIDLPVHADTMRMAQNYGPPMKQLGKKKVPTFKLTALVEEYLGVEDFKAKFYNVIKAKGFTNPGAHLTELSPEEFKEYNIADADYTLQVYEYILRYFEKINHNWHLDHYLYMVKVKRLVKLKARGLLVDREKLASNIKDVDASVDKIDADFVARFPKECAEITEEIVCKKWKSEKGRNAKRGTIKFNCGSATQLARLFRDKLNVPIAFYTPGGSPSFKAGHLHTYGDAGKALKGRGSTIVNLSQMHALYALSEKTGRWHPDYQVVRTATGRLAGGAGEVKVKKGMKLNPQGMARGFKPLMECIVADPGCSFASIDLESGEPTATAHYSKDPNYIAATGGMSGIQPYYNEDDLLMLDDIYLMGASKQPDLKDALRQAFDGGAFDKWLTDKEWVQKKHPIVGPIRKKAKPRILGIGYEMGGTEMVAQALSTGETLSLADAEGSVKAYWNETFVELNALRKKLQKLYSYQGYLVNRFGFLIRPDSPHKCLNYWIQSTINGEIDVLLDESCKHVEADTGQELFLEGIIHDELVFQYPEEHMDTLRAGMKHAEAYLNEMLAWDVKVKTGFVTGKTLYEAK